MNIDKFGIKPKILQPKTVYWRPSQGIKYQPRKVNTVT